MCILGLGLSEWSCEMLQRRIIRFIIAWLFDQMSDGTLEMVNEEIDRELQERE